MAGFAVAVLSLARWTRCPGAGPSFSLGWPKRHGCRPARRFPWVWPGFLLWIGLIPAESGAGDVGTGVSWPSLVLWSWERADDLRFIDPRNTGVAYLAKTLRLAGGSVHPLPRLQPLLVPDGTALMAVARIETDRRHPPDLSPDQEDRCVTEILALMESRPLVGVQVDFDAKRSERPFYRRLLHKLRAGLPESQRLSMTALASWVVHDRWLKDLPVDEVVPMLFRMGADGGAVRRHLASQAALDLGAMPVSPGLSTDLDLPWLPPSTRIYLFPERSWSGQLLQTTLGRLKPWRP